MQVDMNVCGKSYNPNDCLFKPAAWCAHLWSTWADYVNPNCCTLVSKIASFAFLIILTAITCVIALVGTLVHKPIKQLPSDCSQSSSRMNTIMEKKSDQTQL